MKTLFVGLLAVSWIFVVGCKPGGGGLRTLLPNHNPVVATLSAPSSADVGDTATLTCDASDPDRDPLTFSWSCSDGKLSSMSGQSTTWSTPDVSGSAQITVTVRDGRGGMDTQTRTVGIRQVIAEILNWNGAVRARDYATWDSRLPAGSKLNGSFSVDVHDINLFVFDDEGYARFRNGLSSSPLVRRERMEHGSFEVVIPHEGLYHIVVDNRYSWFTDKFCRIVVKATSP
jgi:predicted DCC family thiol-disulfide oxidoreductase YuxK